MYFLQLKLKNRYFMQNDVISTENIIIKVSVAPV